MNIIPNHVWWLDAFGFVTWCGAWTLFAARMVRSGGDHAIRVLSNVLPAFAVTSSLLIFALAPTLTARPAISTRALHYFGIGFLFIFLMLGVFFQLEIWRKITGNESLQSLVASYRRWWISVKLIPSISAITILFSGCRLTYESVGMDVSSVSWLEFLVFGFALFFVDGLVFYLPEICKIYRLGVIALASKQSVAEFLRVARDRKSEMELLIHSASFPFVLALAIARPSLPVPLRFNQWLASQFTSLPIGDAQLCRALTLIIIAAAIVLCFRLPGLIRRNRIAPLKKPQIN